MSGRDLKPSPAALLDAARLISDTLTVTGQEDRERLRRAVAEALDRVARAGRVPGEDRWREAEGRMVDDQERRSER